MKKIQYIFALFCMLAFLPACSDDDNNTNTIELPATVSVISSFETTNYSLPEPKEGENPYLFRMNWTKTKFFSEAGTPIFVDPITYEVEADLVDRNFSDPVTVATTTGSTQIYILKLYAHYSMSWPEKKTKKLRLSVSGSRQQVMI